MTGYRDSAQRTAEAMEGGYYHTGDVASRDDDGYITYVGRTDDVFKASDYRISPFELESVLIEHEAVAEAAVVPSPDALRLAVPKAYVALAPGYEPTRETALAIMAYARSHLAPFKRVRRLEFAELPKTISGKIRRVELRAQESQRLGNGEHGIRGRPVSSGRKTCPSCGPERRRSHVEERQHALGQRRGGRGVVRGQRGVGEEVLLTRVKEQLGPVGRVDQGARSLEILGEERVGLLAVHLHRNALGPRIPELLDRETS